MQRPTSGYELTGTKTGSGSRVKVLGRKYGYSGIERFDGQARIWCFGSEWLHISKVILFVVGTTVFSYDMNEWGIASINFSEGCTNCEGLDLQIVHWLTISEDDKGMKNSRYHTVASLMKCGALSSSVPSPFPSPESGRSPRLGVGIVNCIDSRALPNVG